MEQTCKEKENQNHGFFKHAGKESRKVCEDHNPNLKNPLMGGAMLARFFKLPAPHLSALVLCAHDPSKIDNKNSEGVPQFFHFDLKPFLIVFKHNIPWNY